MNRRWSKHPEPGTGRWLWWLALVIAAVGSGIAYMINQQELGAKADQQVMIVAMVTIITCGLCIIGATARLWINR